MNVKQFDPNYNNLENPWLPLIGLGIETQKVQKQENHSKHGRGNSFYERNTLEVLVVFGNQGSNPCFLFVINGPNE